MRKIYTVMLVFAVGYLLVEAVLAQGWRRVGGERTTAERQADETRRLRQELTRMADISQAQQMQRGRAGAQAVSALERVASLEQTMAGFGQTADGIFDVYDRGFQQVAVDIHGLHERILRLEEKAGLVKPPVARQAPPARSPHNPD